MDTFALTASALPRFTLVVLTGVMWVAFALRARTSRSGVWLVVMIGGFVIHHAAQVGLYAYFSGDILNLLIPLTWSSVFVATWASVGFAYRSSGDPFARESRIVIGLTAVLAFGFAAYVHVTRGEGIGYGFTPVDLLASGLVFLHIAITIVVLARRVRSPETPETTRRALRAFTSAVSIGLVFPVIIFLREVGVISPWLDEQLSLVAWAVMLMAILTAHVNYAPEPTSFLVKVVGFAFVAIVTALGVASAVAFRTPLAAPGPPPTGLLFEPDADGGYTLTAADERLSDDTAGEALALADGQFVRVPLGFAFPFADRLWREVIVADDGYVWFGSETRVFRSEVYSGTTTPWVAPFLLGLSLEAGDVRLARDSTSATITWREVSLSGADSSQTVTAQLVLRSSGAVAFRYGRVPPGRVWVRGLSQGETDAAGYQPLVPGATLAAGRAAVENRWAARRRAEHERAMPFAWLILGAGAVVLLAFPVYLREGLTRPLRRLLDGVRRAARGDLGADVEVGARDEIGLLTEDFNRMTGSLREADAALRAYADELETRVDERTAELATSLEDLKAAQAQLVQQEKMASLGALTAGIAHEIKNPLNFVNNFASLSRELVDELDEETDPDEREALLADLRANAEKIEEHGRRADRIVRDMMDHARTGGGERHLLDLNALVSEYATLAYHGMRARYPEHSIALDLDLAPEAGKVEIVAQEIGRVLINLVDNAFDATRQVQRPEANGAAPPPVTVRTRREADAVEIRIEDSGPGISPEVAARIFEPFFTTKPTGEGTGLGLSMSYDIVTHGHGGSLTVESVPGEGATFIVRLPIREES
ncbi:MAG: ATP-binding protein [Bacteroidota bacterium]